MENQEQKVEMDQISARANDIALSEPQDKFVNARLNLMSNTRPTAGLSNVPGWSLNDLVNQLHQVTSIPLDHTSGTNAWSFRFTRSNALELFTNIIPDLFILVSFDIKFHFDFISAPQATGMYVISYDNKPARLFEAQTNPSSYVKYNMRLPRSLVTLSHNSQKSYELLWNCNLNKLSSSYGFPSYPTTQYDQGILRLVCINSVQFATGVSRPYVRIWAQLCNVQYAGYRPDNKYQT